MAAKLRTAQSQASGGNFGRDLHARREAKRKCTVPDTSVDAELKSGAERHHRNKVRVTDENHEYLIQKYLDFVAVKGTAVGIHPITKTFDHLGGEARAAIGIIFIEWLLKNKITTYNSVEKYVSGLRLYHQRMYKRNPLILSEVHDFKRYWSTLKNDLDLVGTPDSLKAMLPFQLFLVFIYLWDVSDPMQAQLKAISLLVLFNGLRMGDLLPAKPADWNWIWYLTIKLYSPSPDGALLSLPKTKNRPQGPPLYIHAAVNRLDREACPRTALEQHFVNLGVTKDHGDLPLFRRWDASKGQFTKEALSVADVRYAFSNRFKLLFPHLPRIGVHTFRVSSNNLMIMAKVPLATRMWFHNWSQLKTSVLSEVIYRRLVEHDIVYHQGLLALSLAGFSRQARQFLAQHPDLQ